MVTSQVDISKALSIQGWMSERELTWLAQKARQCNKIVEFGSFLGRSTRALADNCDGTIWAVDPWNGDYPGENGHAVENINTYVMPEFKKNLEDHIKTGRVIPYRGFSRGFLLPFKVSMLFIDGDHNYKAVKEDIHKAYELVKLGGIISGHDYNNPGWPDVKKVVDEMFGSDIDVEDTIWWTLKY